MTYLDRPPPRKGPPWAHNSLGASVHNALAGWWRLGRPRRTVQAAADLVQQGWISDGYRDDMQSQRYLLLTMPQVRSYAAALDPDAEPVGVERTVAAKTDIIAFSGRIDRLDDRSLALGQPGRELVVVDYKTGREPPSADDARSSLTLALYAIAAGRSLRRPCCAVELHHVPTGEVAAWEHTAGSLERHLSRAHDIAAECSAADEQFRDDPQTGRGDEVFPPNPGARCGWCDFRGHCPEGMAAAELRSPWDGLAPSPGLG
jgi:RecB family exonuclease